MIPSASPVSLEASACGAEPSSSSSLTPIASEQLSGPLVPCEPTVYNS